MKNITRFIGPLLVAMTVTFMTSCQKDEIFNPDTDEQLNLQENTLAAQVNSPVKKSLTIIDNVYQKGYS